MLHSVQALSGMSPNSNASCEREQKRKQAVNIHIFCPSQRTSDLVRLTAQTEWNFDIFIISYKEMGAVTYMKRRSIINFIRHYNEEKQTFDF